MTDEMFDEIKNVAIEIWKSYSDEHGYVTEKVNRVESIKNHGDNWMTLIGMFDSWNREILTEAVSDKTSDFLEENYFIHERKIAHEKVKDYYA